MVKSKVLKQLRKKIEKAEKIENPLASVLAGNDTAVTIDKDVVVHHNRQALILLCKDDKECDEKDTKSTDSFWMEYRPSSDLSDVELNHCMDLFELNMGDLYRNSSWGLDLIEKSEEISHKKARFLMVFPTKNNNNNISDTENEDNGRSHDDTHFDKADVDYSQIAAFLNFRFCMDDDETPEYAVLYVYEIHVQASYARRGIGKRLMALVEQMAASANMDKVMLTVFKANTLAMKFYLEALGYSIDKDSPSQCGNKSADYEILSKELK